MAEILSIVSASARMCSTLALGIPIAARSAAVGR
jgi:hypothetical protein